MTTYQARWPGGQVVEWRNLTWEEFNKLKPELDSNTLENPVGLYVRVYGICRISGPAPEVALAGIVNWIGKQQTEKNPFRGQYQDLSQTLEQARQSVLGSYLLSAKAFVAAAFHISFSEIDTMDADTFFTRLAQAELVLGRSCAPANPNAKSKQPQRKLGPRELARKRHAEQKQREAPSIEIENVNAVRATGTPPATKR